MTMTQPLVWIDLEMTGLDPDRDVIVEIATIITDGMLEHVEAGPDLLVAAPAEALAGMSEVVRRMHTGSGLLDELAHVDRTAAAAEEATLAFVRRHVPDAAVAPLAGNSVHADRMFLRRYMPTLEAHLHYRNVDVSTFKEVVRRWRPQLLEQAPDKSERHRALDDIRESIAELRFYRDALFGDVTGAATAMVS
ncbi:MAG TPA: oligoribonuclease [Euzebyales bacterium]|nr:oligoribonuclease [Euzebyales bacterium]